MIKATRIPHAYTTERASPTGQTLRGRSTTTTPSMDCRQGTHAACVWEHCACPQGCHAQQVHRDGRWHPQEEST